MLTIFSDDPDGEWLATSMRCLAGPPLPPVARVRISHAATPPPPREGWPLAGVASHVRYVERTEKIELAARQAGLGRAQATRAALIPIAKSAAWWEMTQDERRGVFEGESRHIADSLKYLPAIARKLYHGRDLGQPFDFLTWFEFAPEHEGLFDELLAQFRAAAEWRFVSREIDIRLVRADGAGASQTAGMTWPLGGTL